MTADQPFRAAGKSLSGVSNGVGSPRSLYLRRLPVKVGSDSLDNIGEIIPHRDENSAFFRIMRIDLIDPGHDEGSGTLLLSAVVHWSSAHADDAEPVQREMGCNVIV